MTYDRMEAKPITGKSCCFCGNESAPLVKTKCCEQWVCCDTSFVSYRGDGYCQFAHEYYSACHFHYNEEHQGTWQECSECRDFFGKLEFQINLDDWLRTQ